MGILRAIRDLKLFEKAVGILRKIKRCLRGK
jgi:hypothetical protein